MTSLKSVFRYLGWLHDQLVAALAAVAAAGAAGLVVLICADVLARNLRWGNIPWTNEVTEYALYAMTLLGAPWVLSLGAHVRMDLFARILPPAPARVLEVVAAITGAVISAILTWYGVVVTLAAHERGSLILKTLVFPEWVLLAFVPFTMALLAVGFVRRAVVMAAGPEAGPENGSGARGHVAGAG